MKLQVLHLTPCSDRIKVQIISRTCRVILLNVLVPGILYSYVLLRGTIVNRTYGIHKTLYV